MAKISKLSQIIKPLTDSSVIERSRENEQDVVGPVFSVERHLKLLNHQDVQVSGPLHGVENVQQTMFLASRSWREDGTL